MTAPAAVSSTASSSASSVRSVSTSVGSIKDELVKEDSQKCLRCEELATQSQLNQAMFQQCSEDLLAKEAENKELQDLKPGYEATILNLKKRNCELEDKLHAAECESMDLKPQQNVPTEAATTDSKQIHALELQLGVLATQLAKAKDTDAKREVLISKLKKQQQQVIDFYAEERQAYAEQNQAMLALWGANEDDRQHFEAKLQERESIIEELKKKLDEAEKRADSFANAGDEKVVE
ncbi:hypothetical protein N0V83_006010 [Neocucurbitaria cava]|uniref:Uncharacterized protein n=1 Tax=Neocucurbitaria cava TaxID=798079 RepID=A0A9W8Y5W8_9PLEO|nr:hypothetical protein N0V83_006010 [Neocucurbitaria cava]